MRWWTRKEVLICAKSYLATNLKYVLVRITMVCTEYCRRGFNILINTSTKWLQVKYYGVVVICLCFIVIGASSCRDYKFSKVNWYFEHKPFAFGHLPEESYLLQKKKELICFQDVRKIISIVEIISWHYILIKSTNYPWSRVLR